MDNAVHEVFSAGTPCSTRYFDEELDETYKKDGNWRDFPVIIKTMPPEHCFPKPGGKRGKWREVAYAWEREIAEVEDEFNVKLTKSRSKFRKDGKEAMDAGDALVDFYDYWWWEKDAVWHCIVAGDDWVKKPTDMSKWYKSIPYTICMGISTPSPDPDADGVVSATSRWSRTSSCKRT